MTLSSELFGPDKEDVYNQLALDFNGKFSRGDFFNPVKATIPYKNWIITVDTNVTKDLVSLSSGSSYGNRIYTRVRAPFVKKGQFKFAVSRTTILDSLTKLFGAQDLVVGEKNFDDQFIIKGTHENRVKLLLSNPLIRELFLKINDINLIIRDQEGFLSTPLPENVNELLFKSDDIILEIEKLTSLVQLFSNLLDQLYNLGCASDENPNIYLS